MAEYLSKDDISTGEYISRDEALKAMQYCCGNCDNYNGAMCRACDNADEMDIIIDMPAADVQPVKRGEWVHDRGTQWKCSNCGNFLDFDGLNCGRGSAFFCPNCGADMRETKKG